MADPNGFAAAIGNVFAGDTPSKQGSAGYTKIGGKLADAAKARDIS